MMMMMMMMTVTSRHTNYTLYPIPYTLYPIPYTLYPKPYTLYPKPYTLNPKPYTLNRPLRPRQNVIPFPLPFLTVPCRCLPLASSVCGQGSGAIVFAWCLRDLATAKGELAMPHHQICAARRPARGQKQLRRLAGAWSPNYACKQ